MKADTVTITSIKKLARIRLSEDSPLRIVLQAEPDIISAKDFIAKMEVWLRLLDHEYEE